MCLQWHGIVSKGSALLAESLKAQFEEKGVRAFSGGLIQTHSLQLACMPNEVYTSRNWLRVIKLKWRVPSSVMALECTVYSINIGVHLHQDRLIDS